MFRILHFLEYSLHAHAVSVHDGNLCQAVEEVLEARQRVIAENAQLLDRCAALEAEVWRLGSEHSQRETEWQVRHHAMM